MGRLGFIFLSVVALISVPASTAAASIVLGSLTTSSGPYTQNWSNTTLLSASDDWTPITGVEGFLGDDAASTATGLDPRLILADNVTTDLVPNQTSIGTTGGVAEFELANPVVAIQATSTADYPNIALVVDNTARRNLTLSFLARDLDESTDNAVQPIAVQYRLGGTGDFTRAGIAPGDGYIADATTGPSLATAETPLSVTLPAVTDNQPYVLIRVLTANAGGSDEWVGIDNITLSSQRPVGDGPPAAVCGGTLTTLQGVPSTRTVTASDGDANVDEITVGPVSPSPAPGSVTVGPTTPQLSESAHASAVVRVSAAVPPGTYTVPVEATDSHPYDPETGSCDLAVVVTPDTIAPATTITRKPPRVIRTKAARALARLAFRSNEAGSRFRCSIDSRRFTSCRSPLKLRLRPGRHTFRVFATDPAGNPDRSPAAAAFRVKR